MRLNIGNTPEHELNRQREDHAKWERDIERKEWALEEIGVYTGL